MPSPVRVAYLVSHPIQYQAPLLRRIAREKDLELTVFFGSDFSARGYEDKGFGTKVHWDVPLLEGYKSRLLPALRDDGTVSATTPLSRGFLRAFRESDGEAAFDALWVHGYASVNALHGIFVAYSLGIPVLLRAESWSGDRHRNPLTMVAKRGFFKLLRPMISAVLPIGTHNAAYWREALGHDVPQFSMPYAVDNAFFHRHASAAEADVAGMRTRWQLDPNRPVILFAGKLQKRKHADHALEALHQLKRTHVACPYLLIAGEGEERQRLEQLATRWELEADTRFLGFQNQTALPALFALADVFVLPSRHEPWGLIVNEAMAAGCAVIVSSDVGAGPDLVEDGVNGYIYPVGDIGALASTLSKVLQSPTHARQMGEASQRRIATWDFEADVAGLRRALAHTTKGLRP